MLYVFELLLSGVSCITPYTSKHNLHFYHLGFTFKNKNKMTKPVSVSFVIITDSLSYTIYYILNQNYQTEADFLTNKGALVLKTGHTSNTTHY